MNAPDFSNEYPSQGRQIGPAWQYAWDSLANGKWKSRTILAEEMMGVSNIKFKTATDLLRKGLKAGFLKRWGHRRQRVRRADWRALEKRGKDDGTTLELSDADHNVAHTTPRP